MRTKIKIVPTLFDLLIDLALVVTGVFLYIFLNASRNNMVGPATVLFDLIGDSQLAVWLIAGIPLIIGVFGILQIFYRLIQGMLHTKS